jgi:hypothetical protein
MSSGLKHRDCNSRERVYNRYSRLASEQDGLGNGKRRNRRKGRGRHSWETGQRMRMEGAGLRLPQRGRSREIGCDRSIRKLGLTSGIDNRKSSGEKEEASKGQKMRGGVVLGDSWKIRDLAGSCVAQSCIRRSNGQPLFERICYHFTLHVIILSSTQ